MVFTCSPSVFVRDDEGVHRWTVDEYERVVSLLNLSRIELIDGLIFDVSAESFVHAIAVKAVYDQLLGRHPDRWVMPAGGVRLDNASVWNPDVYVLDAPPGKWHRYARASNVELAVEISLTTWQRDTERKLPVYARSGIPEVWVLRPTVGTAWELVRFTDPEAEGYRSMTTIPLPDGPGAIPV